MQLLHRAPKGGLAGLAALHGQAMDGNGDSVCPQGDIEADNGVRNGEVKHPQHANPSVHTGHDPFIESEEDPAKTKAMESTLWELTALREHYYLPVARLCVLLDRDLADKKKTKEVDVSEMVDGSYAEAARRELARRLKAAPTAFYAGVPERLFESAEVDFPGWVLP
jgi:U3 small nucleolar RNA-associated protein 19